MSVVVHQHIGSSYYLYLTMLCSDCSSWSNTRLLGEPDTLIRDFKACHMFCSLDEIDVVTGEPVA